MRNFTIGHLVSRATLIALTAILALGGSARHVRAHAGDGDSAKIHACVAKKTGKVRFVGADASLNCKGNENPLHFNAQGPEGAVGAAGPPGRAGRSALTQLASGETVSGVWGASVTAQATGELYRAFATFPVPLAADIPDGNQIYVAGSSAPNCPGQGQAAAGFLCLYQGFTQNAATPEDFNIFNPTVVVGNGGGASRFGFGVLLEASFPSLSAVSGTFSVTAP